MNKSKNNRIRILTKMLEEASGKKVIFEKVNTIDNIIVGTTIKVYYKDILMELDSIVTNPPYIINGKYFVDYYRKAFGRFYVGTALWENEKWINFSK